MSTPIKEQAESLIKSRANRAVSVLPGDDLTRASWRFERETLQIPLEKSEGWKQFALDNNILDPFQIAVGDDQQYYAPKDKQLARVTDRYLTESLEFYTILKIMVERGGRWVSDYLFQYGVDDAIDTEEFKAYQSGEYLVFTVQPDYSILVSIERVPFRLREMSMPTGQVITAGDELTARAYPLKRSRASDDR